MGNEWVFEFERCTKYSYRALPNNPFFSSSSWTLDSGKTDDDYHRFY